MTFDALLTVEDVNDSVDNENGDNDIDDEKLGRRRRRSR